MPKKSASARGTASRTKPKATKNFELVRPIQDETQLAEQEQPTADPVAVSTALTTSPSLSVETLTPAAPMSAAARLATRRQNAQQRQQQRSVSTLITAEHYSYVRKDLLYIAILAVVMLAIIIVLYFVLGINT